LDWGSVHSRACTCKEQHISEEIIMATHRAGLEPSRMCSSGPEPCVCVVTVIGESKVVPVLLTVDFAMKAYSGSGGIAPRILDLGT
jgi:hypothetical protein